MELPIEDEFHDILSKAQGGLGLNTEQLAETSDLTESQIRGLRRGEFDEASCRKLASALGLNADAIVTLAKNQWYPSGIEPLEGFKLFASPFHGLHVNAFLAWDAETRRAMAFDTGTDVEPMISFIRENELSLEMLFLTHAHGDHIEGTGHLVETFGCPVIASRKESGNPVGSIEIDARFSKTIGKIQIETIATPGHTAGGLTYTISGLERPVAVVGDALFAGSMGGANVSYQLSLESLGSLLSLAPETILAPGHGPMSTVAQEREMNCFWNG